MENPKVNLRLETILPPQMMVQMVETYQLDILKQVEEGIKQAFIELADEKQLLIHVKESIKTEIGMAVKRSLTEYNIRERIRKLVEDSLNSKIDDYANIISNVILGGINESI